MILEKKIVITIFIQLINLLLFSCSSSPDSKKEIVTLDQSTEIDTAIVLFPEKRPLETNLLPKRVDSQFLIHAYDDIYFGLLANDTYSLKIKGVYEINKDIFVFKNAEIHDSLGLWQFELRNEGHADYTEKELESGPINELEKIVSLKYGSPIFVNKYIAPSEQVNDLWKKVLGPDQAPPDDFGKGRIMYLWETDNKKMQLGYTKIYTRAKSYNSKNGLITDSTIIHTPNYHIFFQFTSIKAENKIFEHKKELNKKNRIKESEKF